MRHADEPELTDHDRRAIEEIRRQLDRQFGLPWPEARGNTEIARTDHDLPTAIGPTKRKRSGRGRRMALGAGIVTLAAAVIGALVSFADLIGSSARSPMSGPRASDAISAAEPVPVAPRVRATDGHESAGTGARERVESARRGGVSIAERVSPRESAASGGAAQHGEGAHPWSLATGPSRPSACRRLDPRRPP